MTNSGAGLEVYLLGGGWSVKPKNKMLRGVFVGSAL